DELQLPQDEGRGPHERGHERPYLADVEGKEDRRDPDPALAPRRAARLDHHPVPARRRPLAAGAGRGPPRLTHVGRRGPTWEGHRGEATRAVRIRRVGRGSRGGTTVELTF